MRNKNIKRVFAYWCDLNCRRCYGTGYIGSWKYISRGRCFKCIPDSYWESIHGKLKSTISNYEIRYVSRGAYSDSGFVIFKDGLPPDRDFYMFDTIDDAVLIIGDLYHQY